MLARNLASLLGFFYGCCFLAAQPSHTSFIHYTTDQGLSNDHITAVSKDKLGFLWVGTVNGLNRFDGRVFKIFRQDERNTKSIPGDHILSISPAPDGYLWVATNKGVCRINPDRLSVQRVPVIAGSDTLKDEHCSALEFDSKGRAWTTTSRGIHQFNHTTALQENFFPTHRSHLGWYGMYIDHEDRLWMLRDTVRRFDPQTKQFRHYLNRDGIHSFVEAGPFSLKEDSRGQLWAGTWYNGIWKYNTHTDEFEREPLRETLAMMLLPNTEVNGQELIWVGGGQSGLAVYDPIARVMTEFLPDPRDPYTHNNYLAKVLYGDPSNSDVWIGTEVGLEHHAPAAVRFGRAMIPPEKDMGQFSLVSGIVHDRTDPAKQRYYVAVWGTGLFEWNKATGLFTRKRTDKSLLTSGGNFNLFQDSDGIIWGCMKGGAGRYDPTTDTWKDYLDFFEHNERNNLFWCGIEDHNGELWFGSNKEGLFHYNRERDQMERIFYKQELGDKDGYFNIVDLSADKNGRIWLASSSGSLVRFDPITNQYKVYSFGDLGIHLSCGAVEVGQNGKVYASYYNALVEMDPEGKLIRYFNEENGLKASRINLMTQDKQGKIWLTTEYLLHCFDPVSGSFNYYGKADGLFSNAMTDALCNTPDGEICVGFQNAFNYFYPDRIARNVQPPPIVITSIKVMNRERALTEGDTVLTLRPGEDFFEIEFAGLNYNQQERNQYAYLLEGFNKDWVHTNRPVATFTNLDGGDYLLRMKAANNDGVWNEQGETLAIRVRPPFYKTEWFIFLASLALAGIVFGMLWFRQQQRKNLERFREGLARDLHDEMGSTLSSIRFFSDYASQQIGNEKPQVAPIMHRISESASTLSESMQDIIWAMKTKDDQLKDMATHMMEFGLRLCEARNIHFHSDIAEDFAGKQLQPEVRRNTYLIFKEAVNNAAKYSAATEVALELAMKKGVLLMKITDNGKGFEADSSAGQNIGNGLQNMRQRAAEIGGKLNISSKAGEGTQVDLQVKV